MFKKRKLIIDTLNKVKKMVRKNLYLILSKFIFN